MFVCLGRQAGNMDGQVCLTKDPVLQNSDPKLGAKKKKGLYYYYCYYYYYLN
jgi:hypothetical protein